jgi:6-methylsalicylate decarboxylase
MIDVHAHFLPEGYRRALVGNGHEQPDGIAQLPEWSAEEHVAVMDRLGIQTSLLSISSPAIHFGDDAAAVALAREVNEEGRRSVVDHPGRFGQFAALPLPDVDAAMTEIAYCRSHLDVEGFAVLTNVGGTYMGDPSYAPVFKELDRIGARLFMHPTSPCGWQQTSFGRPRAMVEFLFDTSRTVADLVLSRGIAHHPDLELIVPHAGAALAMLADRVSVFGLILDIDPAVDVIRDLGRLHFDLAGFPLPQQYDALLSLTTPEHLHYGSDYPFTPEFAVALLGDQLAEKEGLMASLQQNTQRLFPDLDRHTVARV